MAGRAQFQYSNNCQLEFEVWRRCLLTVTMIMFLVSREPAGSQLGHVEAFDRSERRWDAKKGSRG